MGLSWPLLSPSSQFWLALGPLLAALGSLLVALGPLLAALGPLLGRSWAALGRSWLALGSLWGALGLLLRVSWPLLGRSWPLSTTQVDANWAPRCFRKRSWGKNTNLQKVFENVRKTHILDPKMAPKCRKMVPRSFQEPCWPLLVALGPLLKLLRAILGRRELIGGAS